MENRMYQLVKNFQEFWKNFSYKQIPVLIIATVLLYANGLHNIFHAAEDGFFRNFQIDSEELVLGKVYTDEQGVSSGNSNLGRPTIADQENVSHYLGYLLTSLDDSTFSLNIYDHSDENWEHGISRNSASLLVSDKHYDFLNLCVGSKIFFSGETRTITKVYPQEIFTIIEYSGDRLASDQAKGSITIDYREKEKNIVYNEYHSQYGLQGQVSSLLYNNFNLSISGIQKLNLVAFALVVLAVTILSSRIFGQKFAGIFFVSMFCSPWVIAFARNLYWVEFTWFMPAVYAWAAYICRNRFFKVTLFMAFAISVFIKSLCGYEYLSAILLFSAAPAIYNIFLSKSRSDLLYNLGFAFTLFICSIAGFFFALVMHINLVYHVDVLDGLKIIWQRDVMRRTYGDPSSFANPIMVNSMLASPFTVLKTYIMNWNTDVLSFSKLITLSFGKKCMAVLIAVALIFTFLEIKARQTKGRAYLAMIMTFILPAVSWYFLAKGHSFIHTHMNYVLWYFGFVAVLVYIPYDYLTNHFSLQRRG